MKNITGIYETVLGSNTKLLQLSENGKYYIPYENSRCAAIFNTSKPYYVLLIHLNHKVTEILLAQNLIIAKSDYFALL